MSRFINALPFGITTFILAATLSPNVVPAAGDRLAELQPRGIVVATGQAALATNLSAAVMEIGFREGQVFKAGDRLIEFDCRRERAELKAAEAVRREMELTLESNSYLNKRRAIGKHDVEISRARLNKASAEVEAIRARIAECRFDAPFDGVVSELAVHRFEIPPGGKPFMRIISHRNLEIELIVPSNWLGWLNAGTRFSFAVDELGGAFKAEVARVGGAVDPVSQTVKIYATLNGDHLQLRPGMSGIAHFAKSGVAK